MQCFLVLYCEISHKWLDFGLGQCVCKENHVTSKGLNAPRYFLSFFPPFRLLWTCHPDPTFKILFLHDSRSFFRMRRGSRVSGEELALQTGLFADKKVTNPCGKQMCTSCLVFCWVAESTFLRQLLTAFMCLQLVNSEDTQLPVGFAKRGMQKLNWIGLLSAALMFLHSVIIGFLKYRHLSGTLKYERSSENHYKSRGFRL